MFLHAEKITFTDPVSGKDMTITAPLPQELEAVLTNLRARDQEEGLIE